MNLTYFRRTRQSLEEAFVELKKALEQYGWEVLGSKKDLQAKNYFISFYKKDVFNKILKIDKNLTAFLPFSAIVFENNEGVYVGTVNPRLLSSLNSDAEIWELSNVLNEELEKVINQAANVGELKPKRIKLYSTLSCPYCKMEESWLKENQVDHEVIHVDLNQEEAQRMVEKTGQMGVPVTEIEFEDAEAQFIVGFDKNQLQNILKI